MTAHELLWSTASAATAAAWSATPAAMPPPALTSGTTTRSTRSARFYRCSIGRAVGTVEVGLISTLDKGLIIVELFAAFDGDGAGIRSRLTFRRGLGLRTRRTRSGSFPATTFSTAPGGLGKSQLFALLFQ